MLQDLVRDPNFRPGMEDASFRDEPISSGEGKVPAFLVLENQETPTAR